MKRSHVNRILQQSAAFFRRYKFELPPFAFYSMAQWKKAQPHCREILELGLGWDITDFGSGKFEKCGLTLFTLRNGRLKDKAYPKPYAEKIMRVLPGQVTPMHFHWHKQEDIINRGGGNLVIKLYEATRDERLADKKVTVSVDGHERCYRAGRKVVLRPGESITLPQRLYHTFWAEKGVTLVGEVSQVNDDSRDNRFLKPAGRFPEIIEDEKPLWLLCGDYRKFTGA